MSRFPDPDDYMKARALEEKADDLAHSILQHMGMEVDAQALEAPFITVKELVETDPNGIPAHAPGAKLDAGKPLPWLCLKGFSHAFSEVAKVTTVGARKYTPDGWKHVQDGPARYMDAFGRHMLALGRGEEIDQDTQCLHKAQMIWNLLASLELELTEKGK